MSIVIDLTFEAPTTTPEIIPTLEPLENSENYDDINYEGSGTSENSDESQPPKQRGRPKGTGGKYTINPNQNRRNALGKKYKIAIRNYTPEQIEATKMKRRKNELDHYYRIRDTLIEARKLVSLRKATISRILEDSRDKLREQLYLQTDSDLKDLLEQVKELTISITPIHREHPLNII
jgi:hypothetical protein